MPAPSDALAQDVQRTRSGRWKMLLLALVCAAPVAASYFSYYVWRPGGGTSLGVLIDPQRPIPALAATDLSGQPFDLRKLQGQWLLVSVGAARCDARCESNLYLQRQLRESLGKDKERVDWVWLVSDDERVPDRLRPALPAVCLPRRLVVVDRIPRGPGGKPDGAALTARVTRS